MEQLSPQIMHRLVFTVLMQHLPEAQGGPALQLLSDALKHTQLQIRELAVVAIAELPVTPAQRVAALVPAVRDASAKVRRRAARSIADQGSAAQVAIPVLISGLRDPDISVRRDCAGALGRQGPAAAAAAPLIMPLLSDPETRTRMVAAVALKRIGRAAVPALLGGLSVADDELRGRCVQLLTQIAPDDERVQLAARAVGGATEDAAMLATRTPPPAAIVNRIPAAMPSNRLTQLDEA